MSKFYFAIGDNCNAKQLYYFCKKKKITYPFTRAISKGLLIDHKLVVTKTNQNSRFGLITSEPSVGHIVPGILFELHPDSDLSIFGDAFETVLVQAYPNDYFVEALINNRETRNVMDIEKAKLSKGRKKTLKQAIKWRNLEKFEACYESAMYNYLYPYLVRHILVLDQFADKFKEEFVVNDYNTIKVDGGFVYFSNHLSIQRDLRKFDKVINPAPRNVVNIEVEGKKVMSWSALVMQPALVGV